MKREEGITLVSLILYIMALTIVISILGLISNMFFSNIKYVKENAKDIAEFNKFNMYFIEDVKSNNNTNKVEDQEIIFEDGTVYTYKSSPDNSIYRNKVKICTNIEHCFFSKREENINNRTKQIIQVQIKIKGPNPFETRNEYVLRYW